MTRSKLKRILDILSRFQDDDVNAAHEQLFLAPDDLELTDEERSELEALGVFEDEDALAVFT